MSFALQLLALKYLKDNPGLPPAVYPVGDDIDRRVASLRLQGLGVPLDALTPEQADYLSSWKM